MPTAGKLIAAISFAFLAYFVSDLIKPLLEDTEGTRVGALSRTNAFIGLLMGWTILGKGAGKTYRQAFGYGLTTLAATAFWCIIFWSGYKMVLRSMDMRYDGAMQALQGMAQLAIDYAKLISVQEVVIPAVVGALFLSWFTEFFARRWS